MEKDRDLDWKSILNTLDNEGGYGIEDEEINFSDIEELEGLEGDGRFDVNISQEEIDELGESFGEGYYGEGKEIDDVYNLLEDTDDY